MPTLSIQKFAQDYLILFEDICSKEVHCVDGSTLVQDVKPLVLDSSIDWIVTTSNGSINGAISRSTLLHALQYSTSPLRLDSIIETIPKIVLGNEAYNDRRFAELISTGVAVVQDDKGIPNGLLDQRSSQRMNSLHMLQKEDQNKLLKNPIIRQISDVAHNLDIEVYVIGGWVRDFILGLPNLDLDFAVEGDAVQLAKSLADEYGGVVHPFNEFGGAHWKVNDELTVDLTRTRKEQYKSLGALPTVQPTHIERDLERRDFTINSMAIAINKNKLGLLHDPTNGLIDLKRGVLRTLHGLSFFQDPTRVFRAARYCARFNMHIDSPTLTQIQQATSIINSGEDLSLTRIGIEMEKVFEEVHPDQCWNLLCDWKVWDDWQPAWSSVVLSTKTTLPYPFSLDDWQELWWMQLRLALTDTVATEWTNIISIRPNGIKTWNQVHHQFKAMRNALSGLSQEQPQWKSQVGDILLKSTATQWLLLELTQPSCLTLVKWWVETGCHRIRKTTGDDILRLGVPKGPQIAELLLLAQHIAWEGGSAENEMQAIQTTLSNGISPH